MRQLGAGVKSAHMAACAQAARLGARASFPRGVGGWRAQESRPTIITG